MNRAGYVNKIERKVFEEIGGMRHVETALAFYMGEFDKDLAERTRKGYELVVENIFSAYPSGLENHRRRYAEYKARIRGARPIRGRRAGVPD
jgi:hypothetical protein